MVHINTGWTMVGQAVRDQIKRLGLGYKGESFDKDAISAALAFTSGDLRVAAVGLLAGDTIANVLVDVTAAIQTITTFRVGVYDKNGNLQASSANSTTNLTTGINSFALSLSWTAPADDLYYLAVVIQATTMGSLGAAASQTGKGQAIGTNPKAAAKQTGQTGLPATLSLTAEDQPVWFGWS